jgi:sulfur carrier protein
MLRSRQPLSLPERSSVVFGCRAHLLPAKITLMRLQINGEVREFAAPLSISTLLGQLGMKPDRVAVELNREIVRREKWPETSLAEGDCLEIVQFVGGGCPQFR